MKTPRDLLAWGALAAALVGTASAEYSLALSVGFGTWTAACIPAALDLYAIRSIRAGRDVWAAVLAMVVTNALSHLTASGLLPVAWPLVVAVSAIAPLVLWRVHRLAHHVPAPEPEPVPAPDPEPVPAPVLEAVPAPVSEPVQLTVDGGEVPYPTTPDAPAADRPRRTRTAATDRTPRKVSARVPAQSDADLIESARTEYAGATPSVRALRTRYGIGQVRAQRVRDALTA